MKISLLLCVWCARNSSEESGERTLVNTESAEETRGSEELGRVNQERSASAVEGVNLTFSFWNSRGFPECQEKTFALFSINTLLSYLSLYSVREKNYTFDFLIFQDISLIYFEW